MKLRFGAIATSISLAIYAANPCMAAKSAESAASQDWTLFGRDANQRHFSPLREINDKTVSRLGLAWYADIPTADGLVGEPMIADGIVYQSGTLGMVFANDLRTGKLIWTYDPHIQFRSGDTWSAYWGGRVNRGLAMWQDEVIVGVGDCRLVAINRKSGQKIWETRACDPTQTETLTAAPRVGGDMVFMGMAGGDIGARGHVNAYDARTGRHLWRFYTVPRKEVEPGFPQSDPAAMERAAKTWGEGYTPMGGAAWESITYDPKTNLVLVGTGAPTESNPLKRGSNRGDELYTNSIVALNADTGQYVWHYQVTPDDAWNYEATSPIVLADLEINAKLRHVVMAAPKNGFFYVLDATNGKLLSANNFVPVFWASHIDLATGRPVQRPEALWYNHPGQYTFMQPNGPYSGAHMFPPMSYSPITHLVYIPAANQSNRVRFVPKALFGELELQNAYGALSDPQLNSDGVLIAWDPLTQRERWHADAHSLVAGGTLSTAGNLVFAGTGAGKFNAFAADTGRVLWTFGTGSCIQGTPVTVQSQGRQLIVVPSGNCASAGVGRVSPLLLTKNGHLQSSPSRLLAFDLGGDVALPPVATALPRFPKPPLPRFPTEEARRGEAIYDATGCAECHGDKAVAAPNATVPDLREASAQTYADFVAIVLGTRASKGMPSWAGTITPDDAQSLKAYVINKAWDAYDAGGFDSTTTLKQ